MNERKRPVSRVNQGIQADTVVAEVLAVGENAQAVKHIAAAAEWDEARASLMDFEHAILRLVPSQNAREALAEDMTDLKRAIALQKPEKLADPVNRISGKLRMLGIVLKDVAALAEPMKAIATLLKIPLKLLNL